jgi:hypothetical protein
MEINVALQGEDIDSVHYRFVKSHVVGKSTFGLFENGMERNCPEMRLMGYREIAAAFRRR